MATSVYMTVLYGMHGGYRFGIPLAIASLSTGAILVWANRHFVSQVIAGAAMGAVFAFASDKVVEYDLARDVECGISVDQAGHPAFKVGFAF